MILQYNPRIDTSSLDHYSLNALFYFYKKDKDDIFLSEIYKRTHERLYDIIDPKVSSPYEAALIVQEVYRITKASLFRQEREQCAINYLTRIADGCLLTYSK